MSKDFGEMSDDELDECIEGEDLEMRAYALGELAYRMQEKRDAAKAATYAGTARELFHTQGSQIDEALVGMLEARALRALDEETTAIEVLNRVIEIHREYSGERDLADAINLRGACFEGLKQRAEAEADYRAACALYRSIDAATPAGIALLNAGDLQGAADKFADSLATFEEALDVFSAGGDLVGVGRAHDRIAASLIEIGDLGLALDHLRESLRIFEYIEDEDRWYYAKYRLGWTLVTEGETAEAIPLLEAASAYYKANSRFVSAAQADVQIAHAHSHEGRYDTASEIYRTTRSVFAGSNRPGDARLSEGNLAINLARQGRYQEAIDLYRKLIVASDEDEDEGGSRSLRNRLASALRHLETFDAVEESLQVLAAIDQSAWGELNYEHAYQLDAYRASLSWLGRDDEAVAYARAVLDLPHASNTTYFVAHAYRTVAQHADRAGDTSAADQAFAQAIALFLAEGIDETARELSKRFLPTGQRGAQVLRASSDAPAHFDTGEIPIVERPAEGE